MLARKILADEIGVQVGRERFYDQKRRMSYPLHVVIFNHKKMLGYFDAEFYEIGFHECLQRVAKEQLVDVIRHELAHYICFIRYGNSIEAHGREFKDFCNEMRWNEEVHKATVFLEKDKGCRDEFALRKVQKLMALSQSSNVHEAQQALCKAQQLALKYNIEARAIGNDKNETMILKRILKQKKDNAKMRSIAEILKTFFVCVVYSRSGEFTYLEILGELANVEMATYVAVFLEEEMENLWKAAKKNSGLKGTIAKNSFLLGLAKGYCNKMQALAKTYDENHSQALIIIEKKLALAQKIVYPKLTQKILRNSYCSISSMLGEMAGRNLNIRSTNCITCDESFYQ